MNPQCMYIMTQFSVLTCSTETHLSWKLEVCCWTPWINYVINVQRLSHLKWLHSNNNGFRIRNASLMRSIFCLLKSIWTDWPFCWHHKTLEIPPTWQHQKWFKNNVQKDSLGQDGSHTFCNPSVQTYFMKIVHLLKY